MEALANLVAWIMPAASISPPLIGLGIVGGFAGILGGRLLILRRRAATWLVAVWAAAVAAFAAALTFEIPSALPGFVLVSIFLIWLVSYVRRAVDPQTDRASPEK
jgi:hypothetical protein